MCYFLILDNFRNLMIFEIVKFGTFLGIFVFLEFSKLDIFLNFLNWKFSEFSKLVSWNFPNWRVLEFPRSDFFLIYRINNFWNFPDWQLLEFSRLTILGIFQIDIFWNILNGKLKKCPNVENWQISKKNSFWKTKIWQFWNCSFIRYFAFSICRLL